METVSTSNRFRISYYNNNNNNSNSTKQRPEQEQCLLDIYRKEGNGFFLKRKYKKAVNSYSLALRHQPRDLGLLLARSRCYAAMGQHQHALKDAEAALDVDSAHSMAVYQKAQVLYSLGHYDTALLFFHKGQRLNPNAPGFAEGVEKAQKALGQISPGRRMKTTEGGDFSFYIPRRPAFTRRYKPLQTSAKADREEEEQQQPPPSDRGAIVTPSFRARQQVCKLVTIELQKKSSAKVNRTPHPPPPSPSAPAERDAHVQHAPKTDDAASSSLSQPVSRDVLAQLYTDEAYVEKILQNLETSDRFQENVSPSPGDGLSFITQRMLFWARFGAPVPESDAADSANFPLQNTHCDDSHVPLGLQPPMSARERHERVTSPRKIPSDSQDHDPDPDDALRKPSGKMQSAKTIQPTDSGQVPKKERRLKKRRKKKKTKEDSSSASDAERLKFSFDTYCASPSTHQPHQKRPVVPPLVRTVDEISTDEWDSEWDELEEPDTARSANNGKGVKREEAKAEDTVTSQGKNKMADKDPDPVKLFLVRVIDDVRKEMENEGYLMVREKAMNVLDDLDKYKAEFMADKLDLVAMLHGLLGNAYLEIGDLDLALRHHQENLRIGQEIQNSTLISRALGNIGRTHILRTDYTPALKCLAEKSQHRNSTTERVWLFHEMAHCLLQLKHYEFSRDAAAKTLDIISAGSGASGTMYQLQAAVLMGVCEVHLQKYRQAHDHFTLALEQARIRGELKAESCIKSVLQQINHKMALLAKETQHEAEEETEGELASPPPSPKMARPHPEDLKLQLPGDSDTEDQLSDHGPPSPPVTGVEHSAPLQELPVQSQDESSKKKPIPAIPVPKPSRTRLMKDREHQSKENEDPRQPSTPRELQTPTGDENHTDFNASNKTPDLTKEKTQHSHYSEELVNKMAVRFRSFVSDISQQNQDENVLHQDLEGDACPQDASAAKLESSDLPQEELTERSNSSDKGEAGEEKHSEEEEEKEEEEEEEDKVDPVVRHLAIELYRMEEALKAEAYERVLQKGRTVLDSYSEEQLTEEPYLPLAGKLHSFLGTAYTMVEEHGHALLHHQKDLDIGRITEDQGVQSRALENLGRVHVLLKQYDKALEAYVKRLDLPRDDDTSARVFHEIANCFFYTQHYAHARDSASLAVKHGGKSGNSLVQLQSSVLLAVCHVKESRRLEACSSFEEALTVAVERDDEEAETAIRDALRSLRTKVELAVEKFKAGLTRGNRMANSFYPMTDWVKHVLHNKFAPDHPGKKIYRGPAFTPDQDSPRWKR